MVANRSKLTRRKNSGISITNRERGLTIRTKQLIPSHKLLIRMQKTSISIIANSKILKNKKTRRILKIANCRSL